MGKLILKALKILMVLVLIGVCIVGLYFLVRWRQWPWWYGAAIFVGLLGLIVAVLFLKKWLFRRREKKFVQRIVEQDESVMPKAPIGERQQLKDLESRWKEAVEILRRSHLKHHGDPLYVLPWYLMLGAPGSGKTTALKSARLNAPVTEVSAPTGGNGTHNCDWWFLETAVILDTAGRYAVPEDEISDKEEWQKFLSLMAKYRKREPINGLILTVGADRLMNAKEEELSAEALALRRRVDEVMRVMGARFPIWVLVTKTDQVLGLAEYGALLPEYLMDQAMGFGQTTGRHDPVGFIEQTFDEVVERLKDIRLLALNRNRTDDHGLLLFPEELLSLKNKLSLFVETAFEENPYQETPLLQGVYFSSGKQEGTTQSRIIGSQGVFKDQSEELPGTARGLFLSDLFTRILPSVRNLISPLRELLTWRNLTTSLGLTAWVAVFLCLAGLLTMSYIKNRDTLDQFVTDLPKLPVLVGDLEKNLLIMKQFREELLQMEDLNQSWWLPRMGLGQSLAAERVLKGEYCRLFQKGFIGPLDQALQSKFPTLTHDTPGEEFGTLVDHLVTRINLVNAELGGASKKQLMNMPKPGYYALVVLDKRFIPALAADFGPTYISYLDWTGNQKALTKESDLLHGWLLRLADFDDSDLNWIVPYVNRQPDLEAGDKPLKPVTLADFWGRNLLTEEADTVTVPQAFTIEGRQVIDAFIKQYQTALKDPSILDPRVKSFNSWYWRKYVEAWQDFVNNFDQGYVRVTNKNDLRRLAEVMSGTDNPYFKLLDRMAQEFKPFKDQTGLPVWVKSVLDFQDIKNQAARNRVLNTSGALAKIAEKGESAARKVINLDDNKTLQRMEMLSKASERLNDYEKALGDIITVTGSREEAFKMATQVYRADTSDQKDEKTPFHLAHIALNQLQTAVDPNRQVPLSDDLFWKTLSGPFYYLLAYTTQEAACELQLLWEGDVVAATQDVPARKLRAALFDENKGVVWKFVKGPAGAFLDRGTGGYSSEDYLHQKFPLKASFLGFLDRGSTQTQLILPEYNVTFKSRPIGVNQDAQVKPYAVVVTLDCPDGAQQLENFNYPSELTYKWKPDTCGRTTLEIRFPDFTLTKIYDGVHGFPDFLEDFRSGTMIFKPDDFPEHKDNLKSINVSNIRVTYVIEGSEPVRKLKHEEEFDIPYDITECMNP